MKMKILTVAVFCAYFVTAFSKGFNRTMSGQVTGKALPPPIVHGVEITRKLSTLVIVNGAGEIDSFGVLLRRNRIAFPESKWKENTKMKAIVYCFTEEREPLIFRVIFLENRIPEEKRLYLAKGIVEVELAEEVSTECWPTNERRYTKCATANEMKPGNSVFAITLASDNTNTSEKPYILSGFEKNKYIRIGRRTDILSVQRFVPGEPLFHGKKIAGMFVPIISDKEGSVAERVRYVLFRKQSIGQSSN